MKIIHITPVFQPYKSGISNVVYEQTRELARRGHEIIVLTPLFANSLPREEIQAKVRICRLKPFLKYGNSGLVPGLYKHLKKLIIDNSDGLVVHLHLPFFGGQEIVWLTKKLNNLFEARLVLQYHHDPQLNGLTKILSLPGQLIIYSLVKSAERVFVSSRDYLEHSRLKHLIIEKFLELPLGVDSARFSPKPDSSKKSQLEVNLLFVGVMDLAHHFKGLTILLQALSMLKQRPSTLFDKYKIRLNIVGTGSGEKFYWHLAKELKIEDLVEFAGFVKDEKLPDLYRRSDLLIFPSTGRAEAFGLVALEAMSSGLPVVASNLPGVRTLFKDKNLLIEPGSVTDLVDKLEIVLPNKIMRDRVGQLNRQTVWRNYTWPKVVDRLEKVYAEVSQDKLNDLLKSL